MIDFFTFNIDKDARIKKIIAAENLSIGTVKYETWLGADIVFEKDKQTSLWNITLYRRLQGTPVLAPYKSDTV